MKTAQYDSEDVYLHCAPLYHVGGLISGLAAIKADARHVFLESFDARSFLQAIVTAEVTAFHRGTDHVASSNACAKMHT